MNLCLFNCLPMTRPRRVDRKPIRKVIASITWIATVQRSRSRSCELTNGSCAVCGTLQVYDHTQVMTEHPSQGFPATRVVCPFTGDVLRPCLAVETQHYIDDRTGNTCSFIPSSLSLEIPLLFTSSPPISGSLLLYWLMEVIRDGPNVALVL